MKQNETLRKKALSKYTTNGLLLGLQNTDSQLIKSYKNSFFCNSFLFFQDGKLKSTYCKNRWCINCSRIKSALIINQFERWFTENDGNLYLVTLTIPNCEASNLRQMVKKMNGFFRIWQEKNRKKGFKFPYFRKLEVTFNNRLKNYHPHFHVIVQSDFGAYSLKNEWLSYFKNAVEDAQDIRLGYSLKELAKYSTKIFTKDKKTDKRKYIDFDSLNTIYESVRGSRIFQSGGFTKEEKKKYFAKGLEMDEEKIFDQMKSEDYDKEGCFFWRGYDWFSEDGEFASGFIPSDDFKSIVEYQNL